MSAMTPEPTEEPLEAPKAWMKRQTKSSGTDVARPMPKEPAQKTGRETR